jgi:hypothetical protein
MSFNLLTRKKHPLKGRSNRVLVAFAGRGEVLIERTRKLSARLQDGSLSRSEVTDGHHPSGAP